MRATPRIRLLTGILLFAACMVSPSRTPWGSLYTSSVVAAWLLASRPKARVILHSALLGLLLFLPYFLLPYLPSAIFLEGAEGGVSLKTAWTIFLDGISGILISVTTLTCLSASDLRAALMGLPVPKIMCAIVLQIVHQTGILLNETKQIAAAMAVRGASSGGRAARRMALSLPTVWLPRIIARAERVGAAMELRGICDAPSLPLANRTEKRIDGTLMCVALILLATSASVRIVNS